MVDITRVLQKECTRDTMFNRTLFDVCKGKNDESLIYSCLTHSKHISCSQNQRLNQVICLCHS